MQISFKNVSFSYIPIKYGSLAIKDINLSIDESDEFVAIIGETGSGKSTLMMHMNALLFPSLGEVDILGKTIVPKKNKKVNIVRQKVGLVFQFPEYQLFEDTVIKDVSYGPKNFDKNPDSVKEKSEKALNMVALNKKLWNRSPFSLSGGEMRRVAIAGTLAMDPKVLILDEPTRGLDPVGRQSIMTMFNNIHEETHKSIVLITHDMDIVAEYAKRVVVLKDGKIVFDGKKEDLFALPSLEEYHIDYPSSIKIIKTINEELSLELPYKFKYQELVEMLSTIK